MLFGVIKRKVYEEVLLGTRQPCIALVFALGCVDILRDRVDILRDRVARTCLRPFSKEVVIT